MTNTSAKQQRARRESDVHDYVLSKPEIKKKWLLQAMPVFFLFLIGTLFCLSRSACLLTRKNLAPGSERKTMGQTPLWNIFVKFTAYSQCS